VLTLPFAAARTTQTAYYLQGAVRYELDLWGRYAHASEAARARLLASEFDQEAVRLSLSGEVARGWYALKAATEQLANARESLANREESLRIERIREEGGESDEFTLKRVQAEVAATRTAEQQFELEVRGARTHSRCCSGDRRARWSTGGSCLRASSRKRRRSFRPACPPACSSCVPTSARRKRTSTPQRPTSALPAQTSSRA
jgi:hypothetical protein